MDISTHNIPAETIANAAANGLHLFAVIARKSVRAQPVVFHQFHRDVDAAAASAHRSMRDQCMTLLRVEAVK